MQCSTVVTFKTFSQCVFFGIQWFVLNIGVNEKKFEKS